MSKHDAATRVLVIDDQIDTAVYLEIALSVAGFEPVVCTENAERYFEQSFDVALVDLLLSNDTTGIGLIRQLSDSGVPVVGMTGMPADAQIVQEAVDAGARLILHKPFDLATIKAHIHSAITGDPVTNPVG